ncbi:MAG: hypothetical protein LIO63_00615 [Akkermansia sp.]|nr:hypothetical protein [Akkermansia sp.]
MACLFLGFGGYFFYDGASGYPHANEVYFTYHAFARAGQEISAVSSPQEWKTRLDAASMWESQERDGRVFVLGSKGELYPLPEGVSSAWPDAIRVWESLKRDGWNAAWIKYSEERRFPVKPGEHPYDTAAVREQWIAGTVCMILAAGCLFLLLRTLRRRMSIDEGYLTVAGKTLRIEDIERIDLRKWKLKGLAWLHVRKPSGGTMKLRADGMTYGGFSKAQDEPAERLMQNLLSQFDGEIIDYDERTLPEKD